VEDAQGKADPPRRERGVGRIPLVTHGQSDRPDGREQGQWLATHIPGAERCLLDDDGHLTFLAHRVSEVPDWLSQHL
jgi:pimeloyl-ACP methyl ester carboxylesterase